MYQILMQRRDLESLIRNVPTVDSGRGAISLADEIVVLILTDGMVPVIQ